MSNCVGVPTSLAGGGGCQGHAENKEAGMQGSESFLTICRGKTGVESKGSLEDELARQGEDS